MYMSFVIIHFSSIGTSLQGPSAAAPPSLEYLTRDIPPEKLDQPCSDIHLSEVALSLTGWQSIAPFLGLSEVDEQEIVCRYPNDLVMQNIAMLRKWRTSCGHNATYTKLATVLLNRGRTNLAHKVCRLVLQNASNNSSHELEGPSLGEFLKDIPQDRLNQPCKNSHLKKIAPRIKDWQSIASFLGLTDSEEEEIKNKCETLVRKNIAVFRTWKKKRGTKANYHKLINVLWDLQRGDLCSKIVEFVQPKDRATDGTDSSSEDDKNVQGNSVESYTNYLQERYQVELPTFFSVQWPPPPTRKVFNLAMIHRESIQRGPIDEELVRLSLRGNVDDIMHRKSEVKLNNICERDTSRRKVILIEGAPGAGKSTLAWHICQKWGSGELFQEYNNVFYIQLRDPSTHSAKDLVEFLPAASADVSEKVLAYISLYRGTNTLFVMDSWDELPPHLHIGSRSIFDKLICHPEALNLHLSSLIITSRPIASGELHPYVTSRIEIVGFTLSELKQYFTEALGDSQAVEKLQERLKERPMIEASCYLPLNAAIVAHLFLALNQTLPPTLHGVFQSLVLCCIIRHDRKQSHCVMDQGVAISSFDVLPPDMRQPLQNICALAYNGILTNKVTFSSEELYTINLPQKLSTMSLIQGVESFAAFQKCTFYNFLHLSVQELLAAYHISKMPPEEQVKVFQNLFGNPRFAVVFQFYAAFTKLQSEGIGDVLASTVQREQEKHSSKRTLLVDLLHCLYEAQDLSLCKFVTSQLNGELNLSGMILSPVDCLSVGYFLTSVCLTTSGRFKVDLTECSLDDYRVSLLTKEMSKHCQCIDTGNGSAMDRGCLDLDLHGNKITGVGMYSLGELIRNSNMIVSLNLAYCESIQEGEDGLDHLSNALMTNTSLIELRLGTVKGTDRSGEALSKMLCTNKSLKTLTFLSLSDDGAYYIAQGLLQNCSLQQLQVYEGITSLGAQHLGRALDVNNSLKVLKFFDDYDGSGTSCGITGEGAATLGSSLTVNISLEELHLRGNEVGDTGATHIGYALRHNHTLKKLGLGGCGITDIGLEALVHGLEENDSLEELDLLGNKVGDIGATHIGYALRHNHTLKKLHLSVCGITDIGLEALAHGLEENDSLEELDLRWNEVFDTGATHIGYTLRHNHTLKKLVLGYCELTDIGLQELAHGLEGNDSLEELDLVGNRFTEAGRAVADEHIKSKRMKVTIPDHE